MSALISLLAPYRARIALAVVIAALTVVPTLSTLLIMGFVVDAVKAGSSAEVTRWALVLAGFAVVGALLWWPRAWIVTHAAVDTEAAIRARLFDRILRVDLPTLTSLDLGQVVARTTADLRLVRTLLTGGVPVVAQVLTGYAFLMITAGYHHPLLGLVALVPVIVVLVMSVIRANTDANAPTRSRDLLGDATTVMDESLRSIDVIRADNQRAVVFEKVSDLVSRARGALTPVLVRNARLTAIMTAVPYFAFALVMGIGAVLVARDPGFSVGELVTVSLLMIHVAAPTVALGGLVSESQEAAAAARRVEEMLAWPDAPSDSRRAGPELGVQGLRIGSASAPVLDSVNLEIRTGETWGVRGDSGSGKSTLLQALHGITQPDGGHIQAPSTALVTSEDVIFGGSIRDAVRYGNEQASDEEVEVAAQRAALDEVVAGLPQGWATTLGGLRGTVLSGGQEQRIRLARGMLTDTDLLLLDQPIVGLDAATAETVTAGISEQRAGRSLLVSAPDDSGLGPTSKRARLVDGRLESMPDQPVPKPASPSLTDHEAPASEPPAQAHVASTAPSAKRIKEGADAKAKRREVKRKRRALITEVLRPDRTWLVIAVLAVTVTAVSALVPIYVGMTLINDISSANGPSSLWPVVVGLLLVAVLTGASLFTAEFLIPWIGQRALARLRLRSFQALLNVHLAYFDRQRVGAIVSKLTNNIELLETAVRGGARAIVSSIVTLIIVGGLLIALDVELALFAYTVFPVIAVFAIILQRAQKWSLQRNIAGISDLTVCIRDAVRGAATIRAFKTQERHRADFDKYNEFERTALLRASYVFKAFAAATQFVVALDVALIVAIGGQSAVAGATAVTTMVLFAAYLQNGISPVSTIATMQAVYGQSSVALDQLVTLTNLHPDPQLKGVSRRADESDDLPAIDYSHVWFAYSNAGWVLKDVSLSVAQGEHLVLVGRTGGGKSSLIKLALRFYSPIKGSVSLFGVPVGEAEEDWLRSQLAYVPQEPVVFTATLRENFTASASSADDAAIDQVLDALGIRESVVEALGGLDAVVGQGGVQPSAGQRQLIAIARAIIADRPILIVDEATSHLDADQEMRVIQALRCNRPDRTIIAVAHHLEWARCGDRIAVIANHKVAEAGTHEVLLDAKGEYARLWSAHTANA